MRFLHSSFGVTELPAFLPHQIRSLWLRVTESA
jgi:hypothetical protein